MTRVRLYFLAALTVLVVSACGLSLLDRRPRDHSTAEGDASHVESRVDAGRDSAITNWNFTGGTAAIALLTASGWLTSLRAKGKEARALTTMVDAIEQTDCKDCKKCIQRRRNEYLDKRVAKLTGKA